MAFATADVTRRNPAAAQLSPRLLASRIVVVLRASSVEALLPVCDVLVEEGLGGLEFTCTTPGLLERLDALTSRYGDHADVGVGTVPGAAAAERAVEAGARFLVTPTMDLDVIDVACRRRVAVLPGGLTPTELHAGWLAGATAVKIFPAETVGPRYLTHLRGPFPDLLAVPSGGVDAESAQAWLDAGAAAVSVGSPLLGDVFAGGDLSALRGRCRRFRDALAR